MHTLLVCVCLCHCTCVCTWGGGGRLRHLLHLMVFVCPLVVRQCSFSFELISFGLVVHVHACSSSRRNGESGSSSSSVCAVTVAAVQWYVRVVVRVVMHGSGGGTTSIIFFSFSFDLRFWFRRSSNLHQGKMPNVYTITFQKYSELQCGGGGGGGGDVPVVVPTSTS